MRAFVRELPQDTVIVSGGARGVDRTAVEEAERCHLLTDVHYAEWQRLGHRAGFERNKLIVEEADEVVAFWDGASHGTLHTIKLARAAGKPVTVYQRLAKWKERPDNE